MTDNKILETWGFDLADLEYYLECHGLKLEDFKAWVKNKGDFKC